MKKNNEKFIIAMIDIDDFKKTNDTYGHLFGDEVLVEVFAALKREIADNGIVTRFGGEEFMIIFNGDDVENAINKLNNVKNHMIKYRKDKELRQVTFSGGIQVCDSTMDLVALLDKADEKLYRAKHNGKNRVEI